MSSEIIEEWIRELNRKFVVENRKITLIIDSCKTHAHMRNFEWVELIFFLRNITSVTQPMDQGIICALKTKYWSLVVRRLTSSLEKKAFVLDMSILSAMMLLFKAWMTLLDKIFMNCFRKCGVSEQVAASVIADR